MKHTKSDSQANAEALARRSTTYADEHAASWDVHEVGGNVLCYAVLDSTPADVTATTGNTMTVATPSGIFTLA